MSLDRTLDESLRALDHLGEGEPDDIGVDHVGVERVGENAPTEDVIESITGDEEWKRLDRPDYEPREIGARILSVKEASAKALGTGISEDLDWTDLQIPRLAERPFRVQCDRYGEVRLYASSVLVDEIAVGVAAIFPKDEPANPPGDR